MSHEGSTDTFNENINYDDMVNLGSITVEHNPYLYPIHTIYLEKLSVFESGIFVADSKGIYTPIENGMFGIVHVQKIPLIKDATYGIVDLGGKQRQESAAEATERTSTIRGYLVDNEKTIIYCGLVDVSRGNRTSFMLVPDRSFIKPISSLSPDIEKYGVRLHRKITGAVIIEEQEELDIERTDDP